MNLPWFSLLFCVPHVCTSLSSERIVALLSLGLFPHHSIAHHDIIFLEWNAVRLKRRSAIIAEATAFGCGKFKGTIHDNAQIVSKVLFIGRYRPHGTHKGNTLRGRQHALVLILRRIGKKKIWLQDLGRPVLEKVSRSVLGGSTNRKRSDVGGNMRSQLCHDMVAGPQGLAAHDLAGGVAVDRDHHHHGASPRFGHKDATVWNFGASSRHAVARSPNHSLRDYGIAF
mmetsp:Transcript_32419/g.92356  ORF Transcript_32419/g.92356 Transcript_32419/m.92356 type:complete len:227 (-) Transcript_32419:557-1237(-)